MKNEMKAVLKTAWPKSSIRDYGQSLCAYLSNRLVGEISLYPEAKWAFVHYGYGGHGGVGSIGEAIRKLKKICSANGWTYSIKGGNPLLENKKEAKNLRDFSLPTQKELKALRSYLVNYLAKKFPKAKIVDIAIYAGMGWALASKGKDGLGIRDIDVNVFFAEGGPRSLAWITKLKWNYRGVERKLDLYWNVLHVNTTPVEYMEQKISKAKSGRWLTIPNRPWVSLLNGKIIWEGRMK